MHRQMSLITRSFGNPHYPPPNPTHIQRKHYHSVHGWYKDTGRRHRPPAGWGTTPSVSSQPESLVPWGRLLLTLWHPDPHTHTHMHTHSHHTHMHTHTLTPHTHTHANARTHTH